jgi:hypothetical protein
VSELLDVRVIGAPEVADQAAARLGELLDLDRLHGPYPSRKIPGLIRFYLPGRLRPTDTRALAGEVRRLEREASRLRAALELLTPATTASAWTARSASPSLTWSARPSPARR